MNVIQRNSLECLLCGDHIVSTHVHDFKWCKCGKNAVDGGKEYLRRLGDPSTVRDTSEVWDQLDIDQREWWADDGGQGKTFTDRKQEYFDWFYSDEQLERRAKRQDELFKMVMEDTRKRNMKDTNRGWPNI